MHMIRVAIDSKRLRLIVFDYSTYIFFNFIPMFFMNQIGSALHGKNYLYIKLGVGISHGFGLFRSYAAGYKTNISIYYKDFAP
jgi:hypothetical protein